MPYQSPNRRRRRRRRKQNSNRQQIITLLVIVAAVLIGLALLMRSLSAGSPSPKKDAPETTAVTTEATEPETVPEETEAKLSFWDRLFGKKEPEPTEPEAPEIVHQISTATISATGDILMHKPVFNSGLKNDGSYELDFIFKYLQPYTQKADLAVANLETTLAGTAAGYAYSGYPAFNCPDEIVDSAKRAGFDILLTANNHCYDTSDAGFTRTVQTIRSKGLEALGTMASVDDPRFLVKDLNGIRVGMICYTYEGQPDEPQEGVVYMNQNAMSPGSGANINSFLAADPEPFYQELGGYINDMRMQGAEMIVVFIHWGIEYQTTMAPEQQAIAQRLADLGVDVIVGGHPHVVQPIDLLTSRNNPEHKTVCLYSMGNAVSNQRIAEMNLKTGHTEDGLLFSFTFSKYSDGTAYLDSIDILPTWVDLRYNADGSREYDIIPLDNDRRDSWVRDFGLTDDTYRCARDSYDRTNAIVGTGLEYIQKYLTAQREARDEFYLTGGETLPDAA